MNFSKYTALLGARGAPWFSIAGWFGRFPRSAVSLSIIILVAQRSGSFQLAGLVSAAFVVSMAVAGPMWSRVMDRRGQSRVLVGTYLATVAATALFIGVASAGLPRLWWFLAAAVLGLCMSDVPSAVRVRWAAVAPPGELDTAMAVETMADESVFVFAPPLVTVVATTIDPVLGFVVVTAAGLFGALWLAGMHSSEPEPVPEASTGRRRSSLIELLPPLNIAPIIVSVVGIGGMFGAFDVFSVAWGKELGVGWLTGVVMATMAIGNTVGSLVFGAVHWKIDARRRMIIAGLTLAVAAALVPLWPTIGGRLLGVFLLGVVVGPVIISGVALIQARSKPERATELLSWQSLGVAAGVPLGGTLAGRAIDVAGTWPALLVMSTSAASVVLIAIVGEALLGLKARA